MSKRKKNPSVINEIIDIPINKTDTIKKDYLELLDHKIDTSMYSVAIDPYERDIDTLKTNTLNFPITSRDIMSTTKITPADIPAFYTEAVAIATSFKTNVGTLPTSWASAMMKIGGIIRFLTESYPHIMKIVEAIKD